MSNERKLKDNEVLIFTDFNNTLVDYATEYDYRSEFIEDFNGYLRKTKNGISRCLNDFEKKTGLVPVVCIVTNALLSLVDGNGYNGICYDLKMTFFNHQNQTLDKKEYDIKSSCEKYIRYVVHMENDGYIEINPYGETMNDTFLMHEFSDKTLQIKRPSQKQETVERFIEEFGPIKNKFVIFAGDSIADDYPMKYGVTDKSVGKIFIRPGRVTKLKPSVMQQFCSAKGIEFECFNPKNNKRVKILDETSIKFLSEEQLEMLRKFDDGDTVILTNPNSRGFVEGIYKCIDIIKNSAGAGKEKDKDI